MLSKRKKDDGRVAKTPKKKKKKKKKQRKFKITQSLIYCLQFESHVIDCLLFDQSKSSLNSQGKDSPLKDDSRRRRIDEHRIFL